MGSQCKTRFGVAAMSIESKAPRRPRAKKEAQPVVVFSLDDAPNDAPNANALDANALDANAA
jgi:hypothetical protein